MRKILGQLFIFLLLCFAFPLWGAPVAAQSLNEKLARSEPGDFIVTAQDGNYSLLFVRAIKGKILLLEEVSVPSPHVDLKKIQWKKWVKEKAPGHTSWTLYEIDTDSGKMLTCFSYTKNSWLYLDPSEQFLTRLLTLPLTSVLPNERKKIGKEPNPQEEDRRSFWNPPLFVEGKKLNKPAFEVLKARWPEDKSLLAQSLIEFYFSADHPSFPFPYWIEVHTSHYTFKIRAIDSGHQIISPMPNPR